MLDLMCRWPSLHGIGLAVKLHLQDGQNARRNFKDVFLIIFVYIYINNILYTSVYIYIYVYIISVPLYFTIPDRS